MSAADFGSIDDLITYARKQADTAEKAIREKVEATAEGRGSLLALIEWHAEDWLLELHTAQLWAELARLVENQTDPDELLRRVGLWLREIDRVLLNAHPDNVSTSPVRNLTEIARYAANRNTRQDIRVAAVRELIASDVR